MEVTVKTKFRAATTIGLIAVSCAIQSCGTAADEAPLTRTIDSFPRQVWEVDARGLTSIIWDYRSESAKAMEYRMGSLVDIPYLQVPADASGDVHIVRFQERDDPEEVRFDVHPLSGSWPAPRIEDIGMRARYDRGDGTDSVWLAVPVANGDLDATILVGNDTCRTLYLSSLSNLYFLDHTASTFAYPVYHYVLFVAIVNSWQPGTWRTVRIVNNGGESAERAYYIPSTPDSLDSDNDGLLDSWETGEYSTPAGTINLRDMGCNPLRKDILVEVDWVRKAEPLDEIWFNIETIFADAPVLNPDGSRGISLHIDRGQDGRCGPFNRGGTTLAPHATISLTGADMGDHRSLRSYKSDPDNFDPVRRDIFHYCIFGMLMPGNEPASGEGEIWGNDFLIAIADWDVRGKEIAEIGTFVHELGHNLALHHGGIQNDSADMDCQYKPNQPSSMNYLYQMSGVSSDCDLKSEPVHTYSQGMLAPLHLVDAFVDEWRGICDSHPCDVNGDGETDSQSVLTPCGCSAPWYYDYDEWGNVKLNFRLPGSGWQEN